MNLMSFWSSLKFQNLLSMVNCRLETLHDLVMVWLVVILMLVIYISYSVFLKKGVDFLFLESETLEVVWTTIPMAILISIAMPSIYLLCLQDSFFSSPALTLKLISNQWNWQSEGNETLDHLLDSEKLDDLSGYESLLPLPYGKVVRLLITSSDVLHSLGVPSLGLKLDSNPGRLNSTVVESNSLGLFSGSCYELCGSGHSAMPIYMIVSYT